MVEVNRRKSHIWCLIGVLCLMLAVGNSEALVLCIGQDGHVAIEASDSRCCGHLPWDSSIEVHVLRACGPSAQNDDCGACLDIPISSGAADAFRASNGVRLELSACAPAVSLRVACDSLLGSHLDLKFPSLLSDLPPPRSIILLI